MEAVHVLVFCPTFYPMGSMLSEKCHNNLILEGMLGAYRHIAVMDIMQDVWQI